MVACLRSITATTSKVISLSLSLSLLLSLSLSLLLSPLPSCPSSFAMSVSIFVPFFTWVLYVAFHSTQLFADLARGGVLLLFLFLLVLFG